MSDRKVVPHLSTRVNYKNRLTQMSSATHREVIKCDKCNMFNGYSCAIFLQIRYHGIIFIASFVKYILHLRCPVKQYTQQWKNSGQVQ